MPNAAWLSSLETPTHRVCRTSVVVTFLCPRTRFAGFITFGKITLETKELRVLLAGKKPEADRLVKLIKAVKSANPQSALTHEGFECCHPCRHRRPTDKDLGIPTLKRKLETKTEATRRQVCTHLLKEVCSNFRYCDSPPWPRPGARKCIHRGASLRRAHPQSRHYATTHQSGRLRPPLTAEDSISSIIKLNGNPITNHNTTPDARACR